ncbi:MAG: hypothetical protein ACFCGT_05855 [Sandaracinaceae bacterium]
MTRLADAMRGLQGGAAGEPAAVTAWVDALLRLGAAQSSANLLGRSPPVRPEDPG